MTSPSTETLTPDQVAEDAELYRYESVYAAISFLWGSPSTTPEKTRQASIAGELHILGVDGNAVISRAYDLLERYRDTKYVTPRSLLANWTSGGILGQLTSPEDVERFLAKNGRSTGGNYDGG